MIAQNSGTCSFRAAHLPIFYTDMIKELFYSFIEVLYVKADKFSLSLGLCIVILKKSHTIN